MQVAVINAPGRGPGTPWGAEVAAAVAAAFAARGDAVHWFAVLPPAAALPPVPPRVAATVLTDPAPPPHRVAAGRAGLAVERALARHLRHAPADLLVHCGLGAGGSADLLWLAGRLGSQGIAVLRAAELVCHRGDRIDATDQPCAVVDDAARCRRCCGHGRRFAPPARAFVDRWDLLAGALQAAAAVVVPSTADAAAVAAFAAGGPPGTVAADPAPAALAAAVLAAAVRLAG